MTLRDDLLAAIRGGDIRRLKDLLAGHPELAGSRDEQGVSILLQALYHRRSDIAGVILGHEPLLDLHEAAAVGQAGRVAQLLEDDPEAVNTYSADGFTALHLAAFFGQAEVVEVLLARGADVTAVSDNAMRVLPLHSAAAAGSTEAMKRLLAHGADPDARQSGGFTPLMSAAAGGNEPALQVLLEHGADPYLRSDEDKTAADFAQERGHTAAADLLRRDAPDHDRPHSPGHD